MKWCAGTALAVLLLFLAVNVQAERAGAVVLVWTGTYIQDSVGQNATGSCPATGCVGDLVRCDPSNGITIRKLTYSFVSDVCDDHTDEFPDCGGRFTALAEECSGPGDVVNAGALKTVNSAGEIRVCLDAGDCTGSVGEAMIASGNIRTQERWMPGSSTVVGNSSMARLTRVSFGFAGERNLLRLWRTHVDDFEAEPNEGDNCGGGCAVVGVTIKDQKQ